MNSSTVSSPVMGMTGSRPAGWRRRAPYLLAGIGSILLLAVTFLPWYRVGSSHLPRTAWQEDPVVLALLLAVVLVGAVLAGAGARGPVPQRLVASAFGLTLITTLVVVFTLFIHRPGGNAATAVALGGYPALLGINLVKASAVVTHAMARRGR